MHTNIYETVNTVERLYEQMKAGNFEIEVSENATFQVKTAGLLKKALKEIHALGGDYVSVLTSLSNE